MARKKEVQAFTRKRGRTKKRQVCMKMCHFAFMVWVNKKKKIAKKCRIFMP